PAAGFDETLDRHALGEMLAIVPQVEVSLLGWINVHGRYEHPLSDQRHSGSPLSPRELDLLLNAKSALKSKLALLVALTCHRIFIRRSGRTYCGDPGGNLGLGDIAEGGVRSLGACPHRFMVRQFS